ncbi:MAG: hypothetical protein GY839_11085 [candidate division Zixibacteria bacterium]|nr:hypothetical protein [candidate division Zixibacteria bacterium]
MNRSSSLTKLIALSVFVMVIISSCVISKPKGVVPEPKAKNPQITVPVQSGPVTNSTRYKMLVFCDGEVVGSVMPGETKTFDMSGCETMGYVLVN